MKRILVFSCAIVLATALPAFAQKAVAEALARSAANSLRNIAESAEMPEAEYGFQATRETRMNEYGQMVILMRLKGVVPPSTERAAGRGRGND